MTRTDNPTATEVSGPDHANASRSRHPGPVTTAAALYLAAAAVLWWQVWSTHPTSVTTCGCGDAARFTWFFSWPGYALTHGQSLWFTTWLFHPGGLNLLDDTSVVALALLLAPVTALFGPVAAMNVALTLAPAFSAFTMFLLLRRWVTWSPAAFLGGVVFGFSPFVLTSLALNQINIAFLGLLPLMVLVVNDLVTGRGSPRWLTASLVGLLVVQFFVSTEVLLIAGLMATVALVGYAAVRTSDRFRSPPTRTRNDQSPSTTWIPPVVLALAVAGVVLAYPLGFLLWGPAHLDGPVWSSGSLAHYGTTWSMLWWPQPMVSLREAMLQFGGYQGAALPALGGLGAGVVIAGAAGSIWLLVTRRNLRVGLLVLVGLVATVLSLAPGQGYWVPWSTIESWPGVGNIVEVRFVLVVMFVLAAVGAIALDQLRVTLLPRLGPAVLPLLVVLGVLVLVPSAALFAGNLPLTAVKVVTPTWYETAAGRVGAHQVVLAYPVPFSGLQSSQVWQAEAGNVFAQAGGGGPAGEASRAGVAAPGFTVLAAASLPLGPAPGPTVAQRASVRRALVHWGVTLVVVSAQRDLPGYDLGRGPRYARTFFTAVLGWSPAFQDGAWVWSDVSARLGS
jgi:hypothetical protein